MMSTMIGTPQFAAIEILRDEKYGREVDLWSCGIILYNMLSGSLPFKVDEVLGTFGSGNIEIPYPAEVWDSISPQAKQLTMQLLCKDQNVRLSAAGALCSPWLTEDAKHQWAKLLGDYASKIPPPSPNRKKKNEEQRAEQLLSEAISSQAKRRWTSATVCIRVLVRSNLLTASSVIDRDGNDFFLKAGSCESIGSSVAASDWDYSEAEFQWNLSQASSFDSHTDESPVERNSPRRHELEEKAKKWQGNVVSPTENGMRPSRRGRSAKQKTNFARVSMVEHQQARGFKKMRDSASNASSNEANGEGSSRTGSMPTMGISILPQSSEVENESDKEDEKERNRESDRASESSPEKVYGGQYLFSPSTVVLGKKVKASFKAMMSPQAREKHSSFKCE